MRQDAAGEAAAGGRGPGDEGAEADGLNTGEALEDMLRRELGG